MYQTEVGGKRNKFNYDPYLEATASYRLLDFKVLEDFSLIPALGFSPPSSTEESSVKKFYALAGLSARYQVLDKLSLQLGSSIFMTYFYGRGGTAEKPNGQGTTNFTLPIESKMITNITLNASFVIQMGDLSFKPEVLVFNAANSRNRAYSYTLSLHYHFWDDLWSK